MTQSQCGQGSTDNIEHSKPSRRCKTTAEVCHRKLHDGVYEVVEQAADGGGRLQVSGREGAPRQQGMCVHTFAVVRWAGNQGNIDTMSPNVLRTCAGWGFDAWWVELRRGYRGGRRRNDAQGSVHVGVVIASGCNSSCRVVLEVLGGDGRSRFMARDHAGDGKEAQDCHCWCKALGNTYRPELSVNTYINDSLTV